MKRRVLALSILVFAIGEAKAEDIALTDDISRGELGRFAASLDTGPKTFSYRFNFPNDARSDRVWGIDVSHHNGTIDWSKVANQPITFAFVKATQGVNYYDRTFAPNWQSLAELRSKGSKIYRGAYHFLSATGSGVDQANNFLKVVGSTEASDLPPCLDLEWDLEISQGRVVVGADGRPRDRWSDQSGMAIVGVVKAWIKRVQEVTGKTPIIYTNRHWWLERIGADRSLDGYPLWIADYGSKSLNKEDPAVPDGHQWAFWQISDKGAISAGGITGTVDTNVYRGTVADFPSHFGK